MKKAIAATGLALGAAAMVVTTQVSAQAAEPVKPVTQQVATVKSSQPAPFAIGGLVKVATKAGKYATKAGKAAKSAAEKGYVHAKAAAGTKAIREAVGNMTRISSIGGFAKPGTSEAASVESIFDK
ncbi:hypothetical protein ACFY12_14725 [Streptomyces sp. NPDC001339]|uniref:hypothetical protein n=1 Tax=Streptomyces sp. NPDC001339 TaxID=3364563 RepID=UPI003693F071